MAARRGSRTPPRRLRKDRVLQARIPEQLEAELRDQAGRLGLSVSTIVRNVLLNTFNLVGDIVSDSARVASSLSRPLAPAAKTKPTAPTLVALPDQVLAWQPGTLNVNGVCDRCNALLPKGSRAGVGVPRQERPVFICMDCLKQLEENGETSVAHETESKPTSGSSHLP